MRKIVPFRPRPRASHWTKASAYLRGAAARPQGRRRRTASGRGFAALLVGLPLAAFTAVLLMPLSGGMEEAAATSASLAVRDPDARSAADLDAEQPQVAGWAVTPAAGLPAGRGMDREQARFGLCSGAVRTTCVVDGDTIWYQGTKIRIADLDTPEVFSPACANEAALGRKATARLQALLNAGPFTLEANPEGRSADRYGRQLLLVTRGGASLGAVLVREGLAERWGGPRRAWC